MGRIMKTTAAIALAAGATVSAVAVAAPAAQAAAAPGGTYQGCPSGAVCIYPNASWNGGRPSHVFYSYGGHNLSNQYGTHRVFNNQYGGARAWICWGYNGTDCRWNLKEYVYSDVNLSPINSIKLTRS